MIAAIEKSGILHIVRSTGRVRLHVEIGTYCGVTLDANSGVVLQVPDGVFTQMRADVFGGASPKAPCPQCRLAAVTG